MQRHGPLNHLRLNAAELVRHPGATNKERYLAETLVSLAAQGDLEIGDAYQRVCDARRDIRSRWDERDAA